MHAAHEAARAFWYETDEPLSVAVCAVSSEEELLEAADRLGYRDIAYTLFREPDIGNQATALATEPVGRRQRKAFARWELLEPP